MSEFKFRTSNVEKVWADCFGGSLKSFRIMVKLEKPDDFGNPKYEVVQMSPEKVELAVLLYLHKHSEHLAQTKKRGSILWLNL